MTLGLLNTQGDTSIAKSNKQSVKWYREIITQLIENQAALKQQFNKYNYRLVKMLLVKYYLGEAYKLKGFLIQIKIKITNKRPGLPTVIKQVAYIGLFLIERVLEQFKPYFTKIQLNGMSTTNIKAQYMFLIQEGFANQLKQIFRSLEEELVAKNKLENI